MGKFWGPSLQTEPAFPFVSPAKLKSLDEHADVAVLGHSVAAYVSTLELSHLRTFITRIVSDTTLWVSRLFRCSRLL